MEGHYTSGIHHTNSLRGRMKKFIGEGKLRGEEENGEEVVQMQEDEDSSSGCHLSPLLHLKALYNQVKSVPALKQGLI